jgi:hypothetical protein
VLVMVVAASNAPISVFFMRLILKTQREQCRHQA